MRVCLVGNPNCGKTTLFNRLTGQREYVGNRAGVTVTEKVGSFMGMTVYDLPGVYSLSPYSAEEAVTRDFLTSHPPDAIINIVDSTSLGRGLYLTLQLLELSIPLVLVLNMTDELKKRHGSVDCKTLSEVLSVEAIEICARDLKDSKSIAAAIKRAKKPRREKLAAADEEQLAEKRYRLIDEICAAAFTAPDEDAVSERIDRAVCGRLLSLPILLAVVSVLFMLPFGTVGECLAKGFSYLTQTVLPSAADSLLSFLGAPLWIKRLFSQAVFGGVGAVLKFLPQMALLFLGMSFLEDSGYMARATFLTDGILKRLNLSGKSFVPVLLGFGCTVPAVMAARTMETRRQRILTVISTPFMSCGAKLVIYTAFADAFFPRHKALAVLVLYLLGILSGAGWAFVIGRLLLKEQEAPFLMEFPPYRLPKLKDIVGHMWEKCKGFVIKAGTVIFAVSVTVWFLQNFSPRLLPVLDPSQSLIAMLGRAVSPLFAPLGFGFWQAGVALISGIVTKESVISALTVLLSAGQSELSALLPSFFSKASACAFLVFILLSAPCVSACACICREIGFKLALSALFAQTLYAYAVSLFVYNGIRSHNFVWVMFGTAVISLAVFLLIKAIFPAHKSCNCCANCPFRDGR